MTARFLHIRTSTVRMALIGLALSGVSCVKTDLDAPGKPQQKQIDFSVTVTRDGQVVSRDRSGLTRSGSADASDQDIATLDGDIPFGLIGIDPDKRRLLIDNQTVFSTPGGYTGFFDHFLWDGPSRITLSAYYPHVSQVDYGEDYANYSIPYSVEETEAGPLVSKTVERAMHQLDTVPLEFQHITNDIGYKICDVTPMEELQGLIHLRKVSAYNVACAGVFLNDLGGGNGLWHRQAYYRKIVVFEGDAPVGVGSENEKFIGYNTLEDHMRDSHRYYSIPDEIEVGKQFVEVVYDVDGFTLNGIYYPPLQEQVAKFMLYGLLPDNVFAYGKQYTFHLGMDLSSVYHEITFAPSVGDWETKIYENNDSF